MSTWTESKEQILPKEKVEYFSEAETETFIFLPVSTGGL